MIKYVATDPIIWYKNPKNIKKYWINLEPIYIGNQIHADIK